VKGLAFSEINMRVKEILMESVAWLRGME